jgi:hypothetical protein
MPAKAQWDLRDLLPDGAGVQLDGLADTHRRCVELLAKSLTVDAANLLKVAGALLTFMQSVTVDVRSGDLAAMLDAGPNRDFQRGVIGLGS